ncbi:MAG: PEGA domain-containing protein [Betaproteobacteria bacterium]|nr:PEGA domain-containing protein [Betaproteobacteria bacterium]
MSAVLDQSSRTFIGSVVFVDIIGYSKRTVSEQITLKDRFTALLSSALSDIAPDQRLILDTGDGAALSFLGDPEDALFVSMHMRDMVRRVDASSGAEPGDDPLPLRIGINLGPVKLVRDINGHPNIVGDGINVAQRIMGFANEGQIVVSRSFFDVVSVISDEYAKLFRYEGSRTDKHIREHEIYVVGESAAAFDKVRAGFASRAAMSGTNAYSTYEGRTGAYDPAATDGGAASVPFLQDKRKLTVLIASLAAVVFVLAFVVFSKKSQDQPPEKAPDVAALANKAALPPASPTPEPAMPATGATGSNTPATSSTEPAKPPGDAAPVAVPVPAKTEPSKAEGKPESKPEAKADAKLDAKAAIVLGTINLQINPWGEVVVNGKTIGVSPPVKQHKLPPGKYKVEVRNSTFAPYVATVEVKAREEVVVRHTFR